MIKRKYIKNGYVLPAPKFEIAEDIPKQKSCFIDTNRQSYIEYNLGDFEKKSQEISDEKQKVRKIVKK